ncbi:MAG: TIGR01777 family oxidoreductase [Acidimicrobiales bacterium]|jgi:uncharacterized protein (TIGR01777 family)
MRVVVTGSGGLIGGALVTAVRTRGDEAVPLLRRPVAGGAWWDPAAGTVGDDALDALRRADAVVHLAGAGLGDKRWSPARRREIVSSRLAATTVLCRTLAGLERRPSVLVSASAVGYYGDRDDEELTEASAPGTGFLADLCRGWEDATTPASEAGIRVVRLRSGVVLSAQGGALARQLPLFRLGVGGRLGNGRQWLSWITIDDEVGVILHALDHASLVGPVNATAPGPVTNRAFTAALGKAVHRPAVLAVPGVALRLALGSELASEMILAGQRVLPERVLGDGYRFAHPSLDVALDAVLGAR